MKRGISFSGLAMGMLGIAYALRAALMPVQIDTFWHLRAGADLLRTGTIARADTYSFTAPGWPWRNLEWLWEPYGYAVWRVGGFPLLTLATAAFVLGGVWLTYRLMVGRPSIRFALLLAGLPVMMSVWAVRPHSLTLFAIPLLLTLVVRARWWPIPLLFVVWMNAHPGASFGGLFLALATAVALLRWRLRRTAEDRRRALALIVVLALSGLACLLTPLGFGVFGFLPESVARIHAMSVGEWQPARLDSALGAAIWVIAGVFLWLVVARRRALAAGGHASSFADWLLVACAVAFLPAAFAALRNAGPFVLLAIPAASRLLGPEAALRWPRWLRGAAGSSAPHPSGGDEHPLINLALLAALAAAAIGLVAWTYRARDREGGNWRPLDARVVAAVRGCDGPLYNQYDEGGYLLWFVPERRVFLDGRLDPFPLAHMLGSLAVERGHAPYRPLFDRFGIRCAFLTVDSPIVTALDRDGWLTRFRDDRYTVLAAPPSGR
jgi:hypothetical protein